MIRAAGSLRDMAPARHVSKSTGNGAPTLRGESVTPPTQDRLIYSHKLANYQLYYQKVTTQSSIQCTLATIE